MGDQVRLHGGELTHDISGSFSEQLTEDLAQVAENYNVTGAKVLLSGTVTAALGAQFIKSVHGGNVLRGVASATGFAAMTQATVFLGAVREARIQLNNELGTNQGEL